MCRDTYVYRKACPGQLRSYWSYWGRDKGVICPCIREKKYRSKRKDTHGVTQWRNSTATYIYIYMSFVFIRVVQRSQRGREWRELYTSRASTCVLLFLEWMFSFKRERYVCVSHVSDGRPRNSSRTRHHHRVSVDGPLPEASRSTLLIDI